MQMSRLGTAYFSRGFPKLCRDEISVLFNSISAFRVDRDDENNNDHVGPRSA